MARYLLAQRLLESALGVERMLLRDRQTLQAKPSPTNGPLSGYDRWP